MLGSGKHMPCLTLRKPSSEEERFTCAWRFDLPEVPEDAGQGQDVAFIGWVLNSCRLESAPMFGFDALCHNTIPAWPATAISGYTCRVRADGRPGISGA